MFVIANIHDDAIHKEITYLSREETKGMFFFSSFEHARVFSTREDAKKFWSMYRSSAICNSNDCFMLYYVELMEDDFLNC